MVTDNGFGGAAPRSGTGLIGLADRIEALGGRFHIESPYGRGTGSAPRFLRTDRVQSLDAAERLLAHEVER